MNNMTIDIVETIILSISITLNLYFFVKFSQLKKLDLNYTKREKELKKEISKLENDILIEKRKRTKK